jgi:heme exporter protein D
MHPLTQFFYMGGYAFYVWTSYALTLLVLGANVVIPIIRERQLRRALLRKFDLERKP